jgi:hypothetical protein
VGSADVGLMFWLPEPMAKPIVCVPGAVLVALIASRRLQCKIVQAPSSASFAELTVNVGVSPTVALRICLHRANSDVLFAESVAVAVMNSVAVVSVGKMAANVPSPLTSVTTSVLPSHT